MDASHGLTDEQKLQKAIAMSKIGVPLSVIAKVMDVPLTSISNLRHERANCSE
ncbi:MULTISPECIES: hypothetical protein [Cysteiniphilum]|uniref:Uncharacterized protein n=1 Tax=Cysteiniphilum litorale TaxID=2056700 RepID=A0A8J3EAP0_9GAMM|nr:MULTISPECIES: hypothetical protein [Cysteiniphilum]GGG09522.1 hypothetical protein GCM10010995_28890 [Cysteiniphilum litorale]